MVNMAKSRLSGVGRDVRLLFSCFAILNFLVAISSQASPIKIGVSTALTGDATPWGHDIRDVFTFANKHFGQGRYQLIFDDDQCSPKEAVTVAKKFIGTDKVEAVVGFACSGPLLGAASLYEAAKVPVIAVCASSSKIAEAGVYIFRTTPSDKEAARRLFKWVQGKHQIFAVLSEETAYAQDLRKDFVAENASGVIGKLIEQDFRPAELDIRTVLSKFRLQGVSGIFVNAQTERSFVQVLKQIRDLKWNVAVYGAYVSSNQTFLKLAGPAGEGVESVDTPSLDAVLNPEGAELYKQFVSEFGEMRSTQSVFASSIEAFKALDKAFQSSPRDVKGFLYQNKFDGIFGPFSFDAQGEINGLNFSIKKVVNGKIVTID